MELAQQLHATATRLETAGDAEAAGLIREGVRVLEFERELCDTYRANARDLQVQLDAIRAKLPECLRI